jgi:hypothetical protein
MSKLVVLSMEWDLLLLGVGGPGFGSGQTSVLGLAHCSGFCNYGSRI